ncbi:PKD domain-containing protein [Fibrobacterales bacterium]|nr:PKD domain-containing protein [Fibrobacterales bacterium]
MKIVIPLFALLSTSLFAQSFQNPSFENNLPTTCTDTWGGPAWNGCPANSIVNGKRTPAAGGYFGMKKIDPWTTCSGTPDLFPNAPGLTPSIAADHGDWYVGLICDAANPSASESFAQPLSTPLIKNTPYIFSISLAHQLGEYGLPSWALNQPGKLLIYGNKGKSNECTINGQLLWESPAIDHQDWKSYNIEFTPNDNWDHVYFTMSTSKGQSCTDSKGESTNKGTILIDKIGDFFPGGLQLGNLKADSKLTCSQELSGKSDEVATQVQIFGGFKGSPITATLDATGKQWNTKIEYADDFFGIDTLKLTATYEDVTILDDEVKIPVYVNEKVTSFDFTLSDAVSPVNFTDKSKSSWENTRSWSWDFGDGNTSTVQNPSHIYNSDGKKTVTQIINYNGDASCQDTIIQEIVVPEKPIQVIIESPTGSEPEACQVQVTGSTSYKADSVTVSAIGGKTFKATMTGDTTWTVELIFGDGTSGLTPLEAIAYAAGSQGRDSTNANVSPSSVNSSFDFGMSNGTITANATSTQISSPIQSYSWSLNGSLDQTTQDVNYALSQPGIYNLSLITTGQDGCKDIADTLVNALGGGLDETGHALFDRDTEGQVDQVIVQLKDTIPNQWLTAINLSLKWPSTNDTAYWFNSNEAELSWLSGSEGTTIVWDIPTNKSTLKKIDSVTFDTLFLDPKNTGIETGYGQISMNTQATLPSGDSIISQTVSPIDSMTPLIKTAYLFGASNTEGKDTLYFDFTENLDTASFNAASPFQIRALEKDYTPSLEFPKATRRHLGWSRSGKNLGLLLTAAERTNLKFKPLPGDSVKAANCQGCITDLAGNIASEKSPLVEFLGVIKSVFESNILINFDDVEKYTSQTNSQGNQVIFGEPEGIERGVTLEEVSQGRAGVMTYFSIDLDTKKDKNGQLVEVTKEDLSWNYKLYYYTSTGDYVASQNGNLLCTDKMFNGNCLTSPIRAIFLPWNLRSQEGRLVGSGAYMQQIQMEGSDATFTIGVNR